MKVTIIYYQYPLHPQGSYFQEFVNALGEKNIEIFLVATHHPKNSDFKKSPRVTILWVPVIDLPVLRDVSFIINALVKVLLSKRLRESDIINVVGARGVLAGYVLAKIKSIPLICTIEIISPKAKGLVQGMVYLSSRLLYSKIPFDKIICWSHYHYEHYLKEWGIPPKKVVFIPGGIDTTMFNPEVDGSMIKQKYAPDRFLIVYAKPLYRENWLIAELLIRSIKLIESTVEFKLLLGQGEGRPILEKLITSLDLQDKVEFMDRVPFTNIPQYLAAADLVAIPFIYEATTSRSLMEALACGKPVISTNLGEVPNVIKNRENAILVRPDEKEIADAIVEVYSNSGLAKSLSENAVRLIKGKYTVEVVIDRTIQTYNECLHSAQRRRRIN